MTDIIKAVYDTVAAYAGDGRYFVLALICLVILLTDRRLRGAYGYPTLLLGFILVNPVILYKLSNGILKDARIYKLYLALPIFIILSFGLARLSKKNIIMFLLVALLALTGTPVTDGFSATQNPYKPENDVITVCDKIEDLAADNGISPDSQIKAVFPAELVTEVRQYDGRIVLEFARRPKNTETSPRAKSMAKLMEKEVTDSDLLAKKAEKDGCDFLVIPSGKGIMGDFAGERYILLAETENHCIYGKNIKS